MCRVCKLPSTFSSAKMAKVTLWLSERICHGLHLRRINTSDFSHPSGFELSCFLPYREQSGVIG